MNSVKATRQKLFSLIESKTEELVGLTQDLVRFPTINPPGDAYYDCALFMGKWLGARGHGVQYVRGEGAPGDSNKYPRVNVISRKEGRAPGTTVHFNGHIDVVEEGKGWTAQPFKPEIRDGKVFGRGTCDMKGGIAASMIAVDAIFQSGIQFNGALEISGTVDEESGGYAGVAYLAERGHFSKPRVDHVIIPEPLGVDRICLGHRGVWWAEIQTHGRIAHGSMPFLGDCAVRHMGAVIEAFEDTLIPRLQNRRTTMPVVPDGARQSTLNINSIHGGLDEPEEGYTGLPSALVPDRCRMVVDRRFLIEENLEDVRSELHDILENIKQDRDKFDFRVKELFSVLPTMTERDAPVVEAVADAIRHRVG